MSGVYTQSVDVANPGTTPVSYTMNLAHGTYYFVVIAIGTSGVESSFSIEVSVTM